MASATCPKAPVSSIIAPQMIREAVLRELGAKEWNLLDLSKASGVTYSRLHDWLSDHGAGKRGPSIENLEKILATLGLELRTKRRAKGGR